MERPFRFHTAEGLQANPDSLGQTTELPLWPQERRRTYTGSEGCVQNGTDGPAHRPLSLRDNVIPVGAMLSYCLPSLQGPLTAQLTPGSEPPALLLVV